MDPQLSEHKRKFQLDRLVFFSDAVFAIALTLLVLEIKIPEIPKETVTNALLNESLNELAPKIAGFIVSFCIIGLYWFKHHTLFGYVTGYDNRLIWLNMLYLFTIAIMPFTTGFYSAYMLHPEQTPFILYIGNIIASGSILVAMLIYVQNPKRKLSEGLENKLHYNFFLVRSILIPFAFILIALVYLFFPDYSFFAFLIIPLTFVPMSMYFKKKITKQNTEAVQGKL